ncbi:MAG: response regulator transcription factor [Gaiellales bacterium]
MQRKRELMRSKDPGRASGVEPQELSVTVLAADDIRGRRAESILAAGGLRSRGRAARPEGLLDDERSLEIRAIVVVAEEFDAEVGGWFRALRQRLPAAALVCVIGSLTPRVVRDALASGADGLLLEQDAEAGLGPAVRAACAGQITLPRELGRDLAAPRLSSREKQVLGMVVMGFTNGEIARKLYLAESTVKSHLSSSFAKLGVRSRNEATALILDPERGLGTGILAISEGGERLGPGS